MACSVRTSSSRFCVYRRKGFMPLSGDKAPIVSLHSYISAPLRMMAPLPVLVLLVATCTLLASGQEAPQQVHLSPTGIHSELHVSWVAQADCAEGTVEWGTAYSGKLTHTASADCTHFTTGMKVAIAIYNATMTGLKSRTDYLYRVNVSDVPSSFFNFTSYPGVRRTGDAKVYAVFADFGETNDVSLQQLQDEARSGAYDFVILAGDLAYDLSTTGGERGNQFMRDMEPILSAVPMAVAPGNHEKADDFAHYYNRFPGNAILAANSGSDSATGMYYSFNDGLVHWLFFDTELYWYGGADKAAQLAWMQADLAAVDRSVTPWVIAAGHKCGTWMDNIGAKNWTELEDVLDAGAVDAMYCGHVHNYQRLLPQRHNIVESDGCIAADYSAYYNCTNIAYFVVGSPGCREKISTGKANAGVAKQILEYGYGHLTVFNSSHLHWQWQQTGTQATDGSMRFEALPQGHEAEADDVWIIKTK